MTISRIIHVDEDFGSGDITEPVTVAAVKDYLRLGGFDDDDSGEDFDDELIRNMITEGRMWVEKYTNIHVVPKTLTVVLLNQAGAQNLPGPITGAIELSYDCSGSDPITNARYRGTDFRQLVTPYEGELVAVYEAGYSTPPIWVTNAIKAYIADHYEHRGDDTIPAEHERAKSICRVHRRPNLWG